MPSKNHSQAEANVQLNQEVRWRLLVCKKNFLKDLGNLQRILYKQGTLSDADVERVANKWGIPRIPWEAIMCCSTPEDVHGNAFLDSLGLRWGPGAFGVSYAPVAAHEVKEGRFALLMVDLEHTAENLAPLVKNEIIRLQKSLPKRKASVKRKHPTKYDLYLRVWHFRQQRIPADEIAPKLWPKEWAEQGGRNSHYGEKGPLIQRVYDYEKACQKLIDSIQPKTPARKIKK